MARPARYNRRRVFPQAARRYGRLPAVMHGSAFRAVSLPRRNSVTIRWQLLSNHVSSLGKSNVAYTVKMCQSRRAFDVLGLMKIWKDSGFWMKIGRKSKIQFEIYAQNYKVK